MLVGIPGAAAALAYSTGAAECRTVNGDAYATRAHESADRLVDGAGLRAVPRDHAEHVDGVRVARAGAEAGADVRPVAGVAAKHDQNLGPVATSPRLAIVAPLRACRVQH